MSVANELNRILNAKNAIKTAIQDKGGSVGDSIDTYASAIDNLQIGGGGGTGEGITIPEIADTDPLTFVCIADTDNSGVSLNIQGVSPTSKTFEYNKNDIGWQSYTEGTHIPMKVGDLVRFRSDNITALSKTDSEYRYFKTTGIYNCGGNIMSLFNNAEAFINGDACAYLFYNCNITSAPVLPVSGANLTGHCYYRMFSNCIFLLKAPELPATKAPTYCYAYMFNGCTSLTKAPELPATELTQYCYYHMFDGCTSLTSAPTILPATTLYNYCYQYMFDGCTSLTSAPELPATTLQTYCYGYMFNGCTSLTTAPELPARTLANNCYSNMFNGCTSLTKAPELPATELKTYCYSNMFKGCTSLTSAPELPATTLQTYCYEYMFQGCTSLTTAPELPATELKTYCYQYMFQGCSNLTSAPELPARVLVSSCYRLMFQNCSKLNYVKAMFTTTPSTSYTNNWLEGVASTGTFVKNSAATWTTTGINGVPRTWTIETADA